MQEIERYKLGKLVSTVIGDHKIIPGSELDINTTILDFQLPTSFCPPTWLLINACSGSKNGKHILFDSHDTIISPNFT